MMRILHLISSVDLAGGGPIEAVRQLSLASEAQGHVVEIASLDAPGSPFLKAVPFVVHALGPGRGKYGYSARYVPWLREHGGEYDIVIVNGLWQYHSFGCWRALRGGTTPYAVFAHGMLDPWFKRAYPLKHLKKLLYWPWGDYRVLRDASAVLFTCEKERLLARQSFSLYQAREKVVNLGVAVPPANNESGGELLKRFPELQGKRIAIFLGRLHEKKGCDLLLRAFADVLASDPTWHLLMCGPDQGGEKARLLNIVTQLRLKERVTWAGMVTGELKWAALRNSEIFVLPSHQENFGIAVAEALACGVPVLISDQVNICHEVQESGGGIIAADDLKGTCSLLQSWVNLTAQQKEQMRQRAVNCFLDRFEAHNATKTLLDTLAEVAGHERSKHA